ncbi:hypothetical protein AAFF_G00435960 [Aldrovandia affinis]|uniref:Uncharacterized protein n=1 Tax=Aldrovandia affinis TaxID=143900 RepID=A0AAD7S8D4_9TELE|nr:hypothetical protein AAFF_G00435960 [Aldrovandia affinis]
MQAAHTETHICPPAESERKRKRKIEQYHTHTHAPHAGRRSDRRWGHPKPCAPLLVVALVGPVLLGSRWRPLAPLESFSTARPAPGAVPSTWGVGDAAPEQPRVPRAFSTTVVLLPP